MEQHPFILEKAIWTQDDFEIMGWHDNLIYGFCFMPESIQWTHLAFDIDYIFQWNDVDENNRTFSYWIAPCTLVFKDTWDQVINIDRRQGLTDMFEIADIHMVSRPQGADDEVYEFKIEFHDGFISFKASGYQQIVRKHPIFKRQQYLSLEEREGISFGLTPCTIGNL